MNSRGDSPRGRPSKSPNDTPILPQGEETHFTGIFTLSATNPREVSDLAYLYVGAILT